MERNTRDRRPTQISLILRICCGGYLLYLAWELRNAAFRGENGIWYGLAAVVFALAVYYTVKQL